MYCVCGVAWLVLCSERLGEEMVGGVGGCKSSLLVGSKANVGAAGQVKMVARLK
jgi:hypothetical protein